MKAGEHSGAMLPVFNVHNGPLIKSFLTFVPEKTHTLGRVYAVHIWGTQSASHVGAIIHWHSAHNGASLSVHMTCDMIQVGSSVSRRTPTRRIPTAPPSRACWRPTSRACGPSSSTAPPTSLPSSTRWLGETHDTWHKGKVLLLREIRPIIQEMNEYVLFARSTRSLLEARCVCHQC